MTENDFDNPFQSPVPSQPNSTPPFPTGEFWGISGALLFFCLVLMVSPGLGILGLIIVVPGLLRGFLAIRKGQLNGDLRVHPAPLIIGSVLLMIPVLMSAAICFGVTCFAAAMVVDEVVDFLPGNDPYLGIVIGLLVGLACGVITFGLVFWLLLPRRAAAIGTTPFKKPEP